MGFWRHRWLKRGDGPGTEAEPGQPGPGLKVGYPVVLAVGVVIAYAFIWAFVYQPKLAVQNPVAVEQELACLALNIYHEARGEPSEGKLAVGHVVMNRVADRRFPDSVCAVVKQGGWLRLFGCQFSWWCDGRSDDPSEMSAWQDSIQHARKVLWGATADPTNGALWYHADYVAPAWRKTMLTGPKIGKHIFYLPPTR